jgi:hypothetical protein
MGEIRQSQVQSYFLRGETGSTTTEQGRALENLTCYLFELIPGIVVTHRNIANAFHTEEIDVAFWNDQHRRGLWFLPTILLVECKTWIRSVGSDEVAYFVRRLQNRGLDFGILISTHGVTGSPSSLTDAHFEIASALKDGIRIVVLDRREIEHLAHTDDLVRLLKRKLCMLAVRSTCF